MLLLVLRTHGVALEVGGGTLVRPSESRTYVTTRAEVGVCDSRSRRDEGDPPGRKQVYATHAVGEKKAAPPGNRPGNTVRNPTPPPRLNSLEGEDLDKQCGR